MESTANFQKRVMTSIDAICAARILKDTHHRLNSSVQNLPVSAKDKNAPTVSSEAKLLHDYICGFSIGDSNLQNPTLKEIHSFLSEATKDYRNRPKTIQEVIGRTQSKGIVLSSTLQYARILEY